MFEHGFPPYWSTIKKLIWLVGTGIVGGVTEIWKTVTGTLIHITDALASPMQKCEVTLEPIQAGSGDPSPTNVRPITGWTGCEVYRTGVNVWDEEWEVGGYADSNGNPWETSDRIRSKKENYISIKPSTTYYFYCGTDSNFDMYFYGLDKSYVSHVSRTRNVIFITPANAYYMRFATYNAYGTTYNHDISINYPSTDTSYHAYNGTTLSVTFPDTVYGGSHEFVSGGLKPTHKIIDLGSLTWVFYTYNGYSGGYCNNGISSDAKAYNHSVSPSAWCSALNVKSDDNFNLYNEGADLTINAFKSIKITIPNVNDAQSLKAALNGVQLVYELAKPTEIQLTPQEISTLKGENNVWSNGDSVEITYKAQAE